MLKVEDKLFQNRYRVDADRPHISVKDVTVCTDLCITRQCTVCCPAGCWTHEDEKIALITDGCLECGTCRFVCDKFKNAEWSYPRGGYGILFKFG